MCYQKFDGMTPEGQIASNIDYSDIQSYCAKYRIPFKSMKPCYSNIFCQNNKYTVYGRDTSYGGDTVYWVWKNKKTGIFFKHSDITNKKIFLPRFS